MRGRAPDVAHGAEYKGLRVDYEFYRNLGRRQWAHDGLKPAGPLATLAAAWRLAHLIAPQSPYMFYTFIKICENGAHFDQNL